MVPESALRILRDAELANRQPVLWGSNGVWLVELLHEGVAAGRAIYKPRAGEAPLWDFPDGTLYRREYAAYLTSRALGWAFVPPTVIRDGPLGVGSVQWYIEHESGLTALRDCLLDQLRLIALFDYLTNNADRKAAHCLLDRNGRVWAIDHGLTFHCEPKQRTVLSQFFGKPVPAEELARLRRWRNDTAAVTRLRRALGDLLAPAEVDDFFKRLDRVLERGVIPEGRGRSAWYWW
ncbi:MAG: SCO1664 family protein [Chloroflexota bacterium]|nr:SCO1664 family protein [Dehalococcoidia bacterium]MDW8253399.1 SCO1664 family protein [Chloroflexota bacterium]